MSIIDEIEKRWAEREGKIDLDLAVWNPQWGRPRVIGSNDYEKTLSFARRGEEAAKLVKKLRADRDAWQKRAMMLAGVAPVTSDQRAAARDEVYEVYVKTLAPVGGGTAAEAIDQSAADIAAGRVHSQESVEAELCSPGGVSSPQAGENLEPGFEQAPPGAVGEAASSIKAADASRESGRPDNAETATDSVASPLPAATLRTAEEVADLWGELDPDIACIIKERDAEIVAFLQREADKHGRSRAKQLHARECRRLADLIEAKGAPTNQPTEARDAG